MGVVVAGVGRARRGRAGEDDRCYTPPALHGVDDTMAENATEHRVRQLGRYELLGHLATGGMAEIHLARLAGRGRVREDCVVVKRLLPELVAVGAFVAMFLDEGKLVARLDHPNVCEVHELGHDGAEYFLVDAVPRRRAARERLHRARRATRIASRSCASRPA